MRRPATVPRAGAPIAKTNAPGAPNFSLPVTTPLIPASPNLARSLAASRRPNASSGGELAKTELAMARYALEKRVPQPAPRREFTKQSQFPDRDFTKHGQFAARASELRPESNASANTQHS